MAEGAASYVNEFLLFTYIKEGKYEKSQSDNRKLRDVMRWKMMRLQGMLQNCPNFKLEDLNYGRLQLVPLRATNFLEVDEIHFLNDPDLPEMLSLPVSLTMTASSHD